MNLSDDDNEFYSESSEDEKQDIRGRFSYMSTQLLYQNNLTLADIELESITLSDIDELENKLIK